MSTPGAVAAPPAAPGAPLVELSGITKSFGALCANDGIDLTVLPGEVHALLGENGAGKSTLTRILYGLSRADAGEIRIEDRPTAIGRPADAMAAGIGLVTQEFSLVGTMTVTENLMLAGLGLGPVSRRTARARVVQAAARLGVDIDPDAVVEHLSVGEKQRVEILKALYNDCRVLVLDEPTAVLVPDDVENLFASVRQLTASGMGVIFISHKLHEVVEIADRVSILRRGRIVASRPAAGLDVRAIAALMVGAEEADDAVAAPALGLGTLGTGTPGIGTSGSGTSTAGAVPPEAVLPEAADAAASARSTVLRIAGLTAYTRGAKVLDELHLSVAPGEIVGVAGVSGNGQTELVDVLCGVVAPGGGRIDVDGTEITALDVAGRLAAGLGRLSEDRRGSVALPLTVEQNLVIEDLARFRRGPFLDRRRVRAHARALIERFDIRAAPGDPIRTLSGGNMQKVLLARAISREPRVLVASQPTRGLDVASCAYVYEQLRALRAAGAGVVVISEDLDELIGLCDRIDVILEGRIVGSLSAASATRAALGRLMTGVVS
ncbi:ABC transporter ATP-binding protein [Microbacterium sp.]|uniref:ABC transporter ATP-binding protein n=1 Tax=Microbacterium sp. TaxID=51671 RepID=UPI003C7418E8